MQNGSKFMLRLGALLFILGLLLTTTMAFVIFLPDMEASLFDAGTSASADESLRSLSCPYIITAGETVNLRAKFTNPEDRDISFIVRSRISQGLVTLMRQDSQVVEIAAGDTLELSWPVTADDAAFGRLILARVLATRSAAFPARENSCGILLVNVTGVTGQQIVILGLVVSLLAMGGGAGLWLRQTRPLTGRMQSIAQAFGALGAVILGSLVAGLLNWWLVGLLLLILAILLLGAILERVSRR